jgi:predicted outer membrane protein
MAGGENSEVEQFFASCLLAKNQAEIEISKLAVERAQNPQVKQFAQQMIAEHQPLIPKLQQIAGIQAATDRTRGVQPANYESQPNTPGQTSPVGQTTTTSQTPGMISRTPPQGGALNQVAAIEKQIAERSYDKMRETLEQKVGPEFDHCYLGAQIACHMQMAAALDVLKDSAPGQVRQIAQETEPKVKQHLAVAEQLGEQLMKAQTRQAGLDRPATETVPRVPR